jgi:hypothetical protein
MLLRWISGCTLFIWSAVVWAISPYIQGESVAGGSVQAVASAIEGKLKNGGFKVVGKYFPKGLEGQGILVATDDAMLDEVGAAGGHAILGATIRVGVKADGNLIYTNPDYWYRAYFRRGFDKRANAVKALQAKLEKALGAGKGVGGDESAVSLANYRYMIGMERLDASKSLLREYDSFGDALKVVRENLAKGVGKTSKIYEVVMPDRKLAVFGVAMHEVSQGDGEWLKKIEMTQSIAGLPYEIYIVDKDVRAPHARFRVALAFPDVGMGQFMRISALPNQVIETLGTVAGVEKKEVESAWQ